MIIRTNKRMDAYLENLNYIFSETSYYLPDKLREIIQADFIDESDCIILNPGNDPHIRTPILNNDFDKCDYEYNQHFHTDFAILDNTSNEIEYLKLALESGKFLAVRLKQNYPEKKFRIIISFSETTYEAGEIETYGSSRVSFHQIRPGAEHAFRIDDLNEYKTEAMMNIEI